MVPSYSTTSASRSPITIAAGFIGAFIVASLAVQMVRSQRASVAPVETSTSSTQVEPLITSQAAMWSVLGER
ncbi:hypothetical protein [Synechococcus sp. MIT S9508]|uniref:hypothetical protein n=1 Tax=Synechococcus sp. MIT S9508 TaxID=1801629 RepID=UPI0009415056|nr:hypothetical protein [Synechococcus sp. MIT S9508]